MKLYIPSVGDEIKLTAPWEPMIHDESRNSTILEFFQVPGFDPQKWNNNLPPTKVLIPAGEILKIDRIYIRKGKDDFDSVTFLWKGKRTKAYSETKTGRRLVSVQPDRTTLQSLFSGRSPAPAKYEDYSYVDKTPARPVRFWAKLDDVNTIEFEPA